jgi:hypothetical protein
VDFLTRFSFNLSGQPIRSGQFAVVAVDQVNFLTHVFLNSGRQMTLAVFDLAALFDSFEGFWLQNVSGCFFLLEPLLFGGPFNVLNGF